MKILADMDEVVKLAGDFATEVAVTDGRMEREVAAATERLHSLAVASAPEATGELKASIRRDTQGLARRVWSPVRQGFFQEYGTSVMPPQPWLIIHADAAGNELAARVEQVRWGLGR